MLPEGKEGEEREGVLSHVRNCQSKRDRRPIAYHCKPVITNKPTGYQTPEHHCRRSLTIPERPSFTGGADTQLPIPARPCPSFPPVNASREDIRPRKEVPIHDRRYPDPHYPPDQEVDTGRGLITGRAHSYCYHVELQIHRVNLHNRIYNDRS